MSKITAINRINNKTFCRCKNKLPIKLRSRKMKNFKNKSRKDGYTCLF